MNKHQHSKKLLPAYLSPFLLCRGSSVGWVPFKRSLSSATLLTWVCATARESQKILAMPFVNFSAELRVRFTNVEVKPLYPLTQIESWSWNSIVEQRQTSSNSLCEAKNNYIANNKLPEVYFVACEVEKFVDINEVGGEKTIRFCPWFFSAFIPWPKY